MNQTTRRRKGRKLTEIEKKPKGKISIFQIFKTKY